LKSTKNFIFNILSFKDRTDNTHMKKNCELKFKLKTCTEEKNLKKIKKNERMRNCCLIKIYSKNLSKLIYLFDKRGCANEIEILKQEWRLCRRDQYWIRNDGNFEHIILIEEKHSVFFYRTVFVFREFYQILFTNYKIY